MKKKDKQTLTDNGMTDIIRIDLTSEIKEFSNHVQNKIDRLDERMRFVNYKFEDVRFWFRRYSISIIYLATTLTLVEALINSFNIEDIQDNILKNMIKFFPLTLSSLVSLIAAIIKFNKYEEKIEDITRATEKSIITIAKLKEVKEELYFCKTVDSFNKINDRFTRDIYPEYLDSNTNIERQLLDTDYAKYMKKVAHNDVCRAKILSKRNNELDNIKNLDSNETANNSRYRNIMQYENNRGDWSKARQLPRLWNSSKPKQKPGNMSMEISSTSRNINLSTEHNSKDRPVPYRGGSPAPIRSYICNKKMTPKECNKCERSYLSDINCFEDRCPYCKTLNDNVEIVIDSNVNKGVFSITREQEAYAMIIQKKWRQHKKKHLSPRSF